MADLLGEQLGNYRLSHLLGSGGYADVYLGEHIRLESQAAIKVLHTRLVNDEEVEHFQNEGRIIAHLVHPHIVRIFDFDVGSTPTLDSVPFMVMEYAPAGSLRKRHPRGERLSPETMLPYVRQVAEALQYAHEQQIVHRDIKPENMLLGHNDEVLLSDFGTALAAQSTGLQYTLQEVVGTVSYMAPEQFQGKARPASDQYALAVVIYEWLCGERPFQGSATDIAIQHSMKLPPSLREKVPSISPAMEQVIMRALAKDHHLRYPSIQAFAEAFEQAATTAEAIFAESTIGIPAVAPDALTEREGDFFSPQAGPIVVAPMRPAPLNMETGTAEALYSAPVRVEPVVVSAPQSEPVLVSSPSYPAYAISEAYPDYAPVYQPTATRRRRVGLIILLIAALLVLIGGGLLWFVVPRILNATSSGRQATQTVAVVYPQVAGAYHGSIINQTANITTSMALSLQQSNAQISGTFTVGPKLVGSGPFQGMVTSAGQIEFTVQSYKGNAPLFFSGTVQTNGRMAGTYCSLGANKQCSAEAGAAGKWNVSKG